MPDPHRSLADALRAAPDEMLHDLLASRRDLLSPLPEGIGSLAARASSASSTRAALQHRNRPELQVIEAITVLADPTGVEDIAHAVGATSGEVEPVLERLRRTALIWGEDPVRMVRSLREGLRHPAGLAPRAEEDPSTERACDLVEAVRSTGGPLATALDPLAWGPARLDAASGPLGAALRHAGIAVPAGDASLRIPRSVHLALRGGRVHRRLESAPPPVKGEDRPERFPGSRLAQAVEAALESVRIAGTLRGWKEEPPPVLARGGLPQRELRAVVSAADAPAAQVITVLQSLWSAGALTEDGTTWRLSSEHEDLAALPEEQQWARIVLDWAGADDLPSLVGTAADGEPVRPALSPATARPGAARRRSTLLRALAGAPVHLSPSVSSLADLLSWHHPLVPRSTLEEETRALLQDATALGLLQDGVATELLHPLAEVTGQAQDPALEKAHDGGRAAAQERLSSALQAAAPAPVDEVLLDADLVAVVPGRPSPRLSTLERWTQPVSRGGALTLRFTGASVHRALDAGEDPDHLLRILRESSRAPVPPSLEILVADARRRHGRIAVHVAVTALTAEAELLTLLEGHPEASPLGLTRLAPTVAVSLSPAGTVLRAISRTGLSGISVDGAGSSRSRSSRARIIRDRGPMPEIAPPPQEAVRRLRAADAGETSASVADLLHDAIWHQEPLRIGIVDGRGGVENRHVLPLELDGGRLRARDLEEDAEVTVLVHRVSLG